MNVLSKEWNHDPPSSSTSIIKLDPSIHHFRQIQPNLFKLFIKERNILRLLSPGTRDPEKDVCPRTGKGWKLWLSHIQQNEQLQIRSGTSTLIGDVSTSMSINEERTLVGVEETMAGSQSNDIISLINANDPTQLLIDQREAILWIWRNMDVQDVLRKCGVKLEQAAGV